MATLMATLLTGLGGTATAGAAAAGAGAVATTTTLSTLSTALTVVGGLSSIMSGMQQQSALNQQAVDEETRATQETINGRQDALKSLKALNDDMAAIAVAGYASGVGGEGSVMAAQNEARKVGDQNMNMARNNAAIQSAARRGNAGQLRKSGRSSFTNGLFGAIRGGLNQYSRIVARG